MFHGVVANIVELTEQNLGSEFIRIFNPCILDILTLWLDWCHMKLFKRNMWLAEDELGLTRVLPFVYDHVLNLAEKTKDSNTTSKTLHDLAWVFHSLDVMVCIWMTPKESSVKLIDVHVKFFLSCCGCFIKSYQAKGQIPFWSTKGS